MTEIPKQNVDIRLVPDRPSRGIYPVSLMRGNEVLFAGRVNPHKREDITSFIHAAVKELPGLKNDIEKLRAGLRQLAAPPTRAAAVAAAGVPQRAGADHPYVIIDGGMTCLKETVNGIVPVKLTNFAARIVANVVRDDGAEQETAFCIEATQGQRVSKFTITAAQFNTMNWAIGQLGAEAIVNAGQTVRDHARAAVQCLSPRPVPRRTVYTHTGWHHLDAAWVYLHGGGAIGESGPIDGVAVELPDALGAYKLPAPQTSDELHRAVRASLTILSLAADALTFPILCTVYRAALGTADFGVHLAGATGVFKSELAALMQQHFGAGLDARHLPGSWHSTDNALEGLLFAAKDAVTVVDDFAPGGAPHDVARWHQRADRIFRAQGNNSGRGRMRPDGTLKPPKPPRGLVVSTGEDVPRGQSLRARLLILELGEGDIDANTLSRCQADAANGLYAGAMAGYVRYLAARMGALDIRAKVAELRAQATASVMHRRTPDIVANMGIGLRHFIDFAIDAGAIGDAEGRELWTRGWAALGVAAERQAIHQRHAEPARRFIELLESAIASGQAHLAGPDGREPKNAGAWGWRVDAAGGVMERAQGARIGWIDGRDVYLEPDASYRAAQAMAANGDGLAVTAQTLRKRMDEAGMVIRGGTDELLSRRTLEGRSRYVVHLRPGILSDNPANPADTAAGTPHGGPGTDPDGENAGFVGLRRGIPPRRPIQT